jgi:hypothetical protein
MLEKHNNLMAYLTYRVDAVWDTGIVINATSSCQMFPQCNQITIDTHIWPWLLKSWLWLLPMLVSVTCHCFALAVQHFSIPGSPFLYYLLNSQAQNLPWAVRTCPSLCAYWTRVTTRPAFRGSVPKTYVKSRVPHFAWNVPQISFFIIY